jgi:hypothetical protein
MLRRLLILLALAAVLYVPAAGSASLAAPAGMRAFLLRADEPLVASYPRTPSFAWTPYDGARSYDFELATSRKFDESTIVWSSNGSPRVPAVAVPVALPWMTGNPYALYAHVRALTPKGLTRWSAPFGFNMSWTSVPNQLLTDTPGLVRWTPVDGATSYQVWFVNLVVNAGVTGKVITTRTNVADEREYYTYPQDPSVIHWRVRAIRQLYGALPNSLPAVSYGPWSQTFVSVNLPMSTGALTPTTTASDTISTAAAPGTHRLTPGFVFAGDTATTGVAGRLYRVYIATDRECVNTVFTGSVVGSPAWAPRTSGPLALPSATTPPYLADGAQAATFNAAWQSVTASEKEDTSATSAGSAASTADTPAAVDLWDIGTPNGLYWWTVVPVREVTNGTSVQFVDAEVPQDECASDHMIRFGKVSQPATTSPTRPYVSGLSPFGELVAAQTARPSFYRAALATWQPAAGAVQYEVQWSRTQYPWKTAGNRLTYSTSTVLSGLAPGTWYYRVRGIDPYVPSPLKQMTWSKPVQLKLARPRFVDQSGVTIHLVTK